MAYIPAKDISRWQGAWQDTGEPIVMIKMSGGDDGLYMDAQATNNYRQAVAAGKAVGGYHFAGATDPIAEANYFMQAMSPLAENDVYALDWEVSHPDPVGWCSQFVQHVHDTIGVWPLVYMNLSTLRSRDWTPVFSNCGLWLADWNNDPEAAISTPFPIVMQQYADGPSYDRDAWFGTVEAFKKYGWHAQQETPSEPTPQPTPTPDPTPTPVEPPVPTPDTPTPNPSEPTPVETPTPPTPPTPEVVKTNWLTRVLRWLYKLLNG